MRPLRLLALALCPSLLACSSSGGPSAGPADLATLSADLASPLSGPDLATRPPDLAPQQPAATVIITDDKYTPAMVTVKAGSLVRWSFQAAGPHGVVSVGDKFPNSPVMTQGTYEYVFAQPGTYDIQCAIHGPAMPATIVVQ